MQASEEQQDIINSKNNTIVVSNPGTGKTTTLALKVIRLLKDGARPESILCITFTNKAKKEMFDAIYEEGKGMFTDAEIMKINIHTFHSFAYNYLVDAGLIPDEIIENNHMRFSILNTLEKNHTMNYEKDYIISEIVPKVANAIRYIKSFGITPDKIDAVKARSILGQIHDKSRSYSLDEMNVFLEHFIFAYREYEKSKENAADYTDVLMAFIEKFQGDKFDYVLVDEMQDMSSIQADIVRMTAKNMFLVGDAKQAIFGFQGGSVKNFESFQNVCETKLLSTNRRSTRQILDYSREYFLGKTGNPDAVKKELMGFKAHVSGTIPKIISTNATNSKILEITSANPDKSIGIIARTNHQIIEISKFLDANKVKYSSTSMQAIGQHAKDEIRRFVKGLLSLDIKDKVLATFTVFSPHTLQEAFTFSKALKTGNHAGLASIKSWGIEMRRTDLDKIYDNTILPVCVSKGFEWFATAVSVKNEIDQYMALGNPTLDGLFDFMAIGEESNMEQNSESDVMLTTIHKAKGREFDVVVYVPSMPRKTTFVDMITQSILKASDIDVRTELEEESLRVDFVAFTRAKEQLIVIAGDKYAKNYHLQDLSEFEAGDSEDAKTAVCSDRVLVEAYSLFVAGRNSDSKRLLEAEEDWLGRLIRDYFDGIDSFSYSMIDTNPYEFLKKNIINMPYGGPAMELGSQVHSAMRLVLTEEASINEYSGNVRKAVENGLYAINCLKDTYHGMYVDSTEIRTEVPLSSMTDWDHGAMQFTGMMDAVFRHDNGYIIVDYKTDKRASKKSKHMRQLAAYRRMLSVSKSIPEGSIDTCVVFPAIRGGINTGQFKLETYAGKGNEYEKFEQSLKKVLEWKRNPETFISELLEENSDEQLFHAVKEKMARFGHPVARS